MKMGIYEFFDSTNGKSLYIGQSIRIEGRVRDHLGKLRRKHHHLIDFQNYFNNNRISWRILEEVSNRERLGERELYFFELNGPLFWKAKPIVNMTYVTNPEYSDINCKICNKHFVGKSSRSLYCSRPCYTEGRKRTHSCEHCSKVFRTFSTKSRWCSVKCQKDFSKTYKMCSVCTTSFLSNSKKDLCSKQCEYKAINNMNTCQGCRRSFVSKRKAVNFCSTKCRFDTLSYEKTCLFCKDIFIAKHNNAIFCSAKCTQLNAKT